MYYNISVFLKTTAILTLAVVFESNGQTTTIGARFTTSLYRAALVENPSPSNIYDSRNASIDIGVYALKYFKGEQWGLKMGIELGLIPWSMGIYAPRNAFGNGGGGGQRLGFKVGGNDLSYKAVTLSATYKVPLKNGFLEISAGTSVRDYAFGGDPEVITMILNRSTPYDPSSGPPDVETIIDPLDDQFHISFPVAVDYVFRMGKKTQLKVGIMNNIAVKPIADSKLTVVMYDDIYNGKFSPRTSFWGANLVFEYSLNKRIDETFTKKISSADLTGKFRKAVFIENHGSGIRFSGNFDTRLKKDVNNGFGIKAGIGKGMSYDTEVTNNKPPNRSYITLPIGLNYIIGKKSHGIEAGIGFTPQIALDKVDRTRPDFKSMLFPYHVGYRYQPKKEGLMVRLAWTPNVERGRYTTDFMHIYINTGISVGYSFR